MMIFPANMHPAALIQNAGSPHPFTCDFCGDREDGIIVRPKEREAWAILPEGWAEVEDCREHAKKQFPICCSKGDCVHQAHSHKS